MGGYQPTLPPTPRGKPVPPRLPGESSNDYWERMNRDYPPPYSDPPVLWPSPKKAGA